MCAVDDADYVTLWNVTRPVAAKEHRCYDCDRTIALGDHWAEGYRNVALGRLIILHQRDWQGVTPEQVAAWADESVDRITQKVAA
jgi:hypothetical protein